MRIPNVTVYDNGAAFCVCVDGLIVTAESSLGNAWRHIKWMYEVASQEFTVGPSKTPVREWISKMMRQGFIDKERHYMDQDY